MIIQTKNNVKHYVKMFVLSILVLINAIMTQLAFVNKIPQNVPQAHVKI